MPPGHKRALARSRQWRIGWHPLHLGFYDIRSVTAYGGHLYLIQGGSGTELKKISLSSHVVSTLATIDVPIGSGITSDGQSLYIATKDHQTILKVSMGDGSVVTWMGVLGEGQDVNGLLSAGASIFYPTGIFFYLGLDNSGLFVSNLYNIRRIH